MEAKLTPRVGIVILLVVATGFASNHLAARIAFDHGASVAAGVSVRATSTALVLLAMMRLQGVALSIPRALRGRAILAGVLIASQSYCLYSAVAIIPPALALLVFQTSPMLYVLLTWALGKEAPRWSALGPMLLALAGLALALGLRTDQLAARWGEIGAGVLWAFASGASMTVVYYLTANALKPLDGRLRTCVMTAVAAVIVTAGGAAADALALPRDAAGWAGLASLTVFYCMAMTGLFLVLPRVPSTTTAALNLEPIVLLLLAWLFLGHTVTPLQIAGAFLTVGAIAWLGARK
jgi:drug/metabolite transporter (DMT)-like permease